MSIFLQQFQADKRVHDCAQASRIAAGFFFELLDRFRSALQGLKNFVVHGGADDQWRPVSEPQLLEAFGRKLFRLALLHKGITSNSKPSFVQPMYLGLPPDVTVVEQESLFRVLGVPRLRGSAREPPDGGTPN